jgi:hypothetical protein
MPYQPIVIRNLHAFPSRQQFHRWRSLITIHGPFCAIVAGRIEESGPIRILQKLSKASWPPIAEGSNLKNNGKTR